MSDAATETEEETTEETTEEKSEKKTGKKRGRPPKDKTRRLRITLKKTPFFQKSIVQKLLQLLATLNMSGFVEHQKDDVVVITFPEWMRFEFTE